MRTLIIGLDAFDPNLFESMHAAGKLPNLGRYVDAQCYSRFQVSNPPQSEVSWTSIATGLNPGGHGMFDFVHRDPQTYLLHVSLLPTGKSMGGISFVRPHNARTIFDMAADKGYPSTSLWWPATFPARLQSPVRTLPGLGAPDIQGRLGVGSLFTTDLDLCPPGTEQPKVGKTPVFPLQKNGGGRYTGQLNGPMLKDGYASLPIELLVRDAQRADLQLGGLKQPIPLVVGEWGPIVEIEFKVGFLVKVHALARMVLTQVQPHVRLYFMPLQIHPLHALWPYGTPPSFVKETWQKAGPFLTLGWPQDTTGLEDGCINDDQFLTLCEGIEEARLRALLHHLDKFDEGLLASVFDSLDRVQHMFWRDRPDVIERWYRKLDAMVGLAAQKLMAKKPQSTRLLIVSDHGFTRFDYKVHLNRWLVEQGYLVPTHSGAANGGTANGGASGDLKGVDWSRSRAYALGLNSLYLNLAGREGQGIVQAGERQVLLDEIRSKLQAWQGPNGKPVVGQAPANEQVFDGPLASYGPDMMVGYASGYRGSPEPGLGEWKAQALEPNNDHWGADHCIDPNVVPGVLFTTTGLSNFPRPSYRDIPAITIDAVPDAKGGTPPPKLSPEDQKQVEERLKSLGYL